ncbi:MAG: hypothetical protein NTY45_10315 [Elusimicrobia bacterium]|nr:hypothetical protein [Elusimicrobiota bacterium]
MAEQFLCHAAAGAGQTCIFIGEDFKKEFAASPGMGLKRGKTFSNEKGYFHLKVFQGVYFR